jgi:hypothetical protein
MTGSAAPSNPTRGTTTTITVIVTTNAAATALIDIEVYAPNGRKVAQSWQDGQTFVPGVARTYTVVWPVTASEPVGTHTVKVGVFCPGWTCLRSWNNSAAVVTVR